MPPLRSPNYAGAGDARANTEHRARTGPRRITLARYAPYDAERFASKLAPTKSKSNGARGRRCRFRKEPQPWAFLMIASAMFAGASAYLVNSIE